MHPSEKFKSSEEFTINHMSESEGSRLHISNSRVFRLWQTSVHWRRISVLAPMQTRGESLRAVNGVYDSSHSGEVSIQHINSTQCFLNRMNERPVGSRARGKVSRKKLSPLVPLHFLWHDHSWHDDTRKCNFPFFSPLPGRQNPLRALQKHICEDKIIMKPLTYRTFNRMFFWVFAARRFHFELAVISALQKRFQSAAS